MIGSYAILRRDLAAFHKLPEPDIAPAIVPAEDVAERIAADERKASVAQDTGDEASYRQAIEDVTAAFKGLALDGIKAEHVAVELDKDGFHQLAHAVRSLYTIVEG